MPDGYARRSLPFIEHNVKLKEEELIESLAAELKQIDSQMIEMPKHDFSGLEMLAVQLAQRMKREMPKLFVYEGVRRVKPNLFIIQLGRERAWR
jgi:hypothetical protein